MYLFMTYEIQLQRILLYYSLAEVQTKRYSVGFKAEICLKWKWYKRFSFNTLEMV